MMSFTSTTSARITNSDDKTTESSWPPDPHPLRLPLSACPENRRSSPMVSPNTAFLNVGGKKSLKSAPLKPALMNWCGQ